MRGEAAVDKVALVELLLRVSSIVVFHPQLSELDLNPVIAYPDGYAVVDARIITNRTVAAAAEPVEADFRALDRGVN